MSETKKRPGTPASTEATVVADTDRTDVRVDGQPSELTLPAPLNLRPTNKIILGEVIPFLEDEDQSVLTPSEVEDILLNRINTRFRNENILQKLKGAYAYRPLKELSPDVIARCILKRDLPHLGLLANAVDEDNVRDTAMLVSYAEDGPNQGLYVGAESLIQQAAWEYNPNLVGREFDEIVARLRNAAPLLSPSSNGDIVALSNGLFDLREKELLPFSPKIVLPSKCEARWDANATVAPSIDGWDVNTWIRDIADEDEEVEYLLWQVIAGIFRPDHAFDKAILLVSEEGSNGKGTFLELLRNLVGRNRAATVSLVDFERPFLPIQLVTSFAVLSDENTVGRYVEHSEKLKSWITHDWVLMDRKNRNAIQVKGRGLAVFCLNALPASKDRTESFYRRFLPVPFKRRYTDGDKNPLIKSDYLKRPEVLDYVAHKALSMPLFDEFDVPAASKELLGMIRVENDPVAQFAEENLPEFSWVFLPWKMVYAVYLKWMKCDHPTGRPVSAREFTRRMAKFVDSNPECGWSVPRGADGKQHVVRLEPYIKRAGDDRLVRRYGLQEWQQSNSWNQIPAVSRGLFHGLPSATRNGDDNSSSATPAPQQQGVMTPELQARVIAAQSRTNNQ